MLQAALTDLRLWGRFPTLTTLDARLSDLKVPADRVELVTPGELISSFPAMVQESEAVLIIAPETAGILQRLTSIVEQLGVPLLGSSSAAIEIAGDKLACYRRWRQAGLPLPRTRWSRFGESLEATARDLHSPLVVKPVDGIGGEGIFLVSHAADLPGALAGLQPLTRRDDFLVMEYVPGVHASVSLIVTRTGSRPLTLNSQHIAVTGHRFVYRGGTVPLAHPLRQRAFTVATRAVSLIPGLRGYVGVDLVLTDREAYIMEVNPRLTTSVIALRQVIDLNLAQAIWLACIDDQLPQFVTTHGQATFTTDSLRPLVTPLPPESRGPL